MRLIIDTSSNDMIAILQDEKNLFFAPKISKKHQENLLPSIEKILIQSKKTLDKVDVIGVVIGPGSFTGIRLAVATVKGFCYVDRNKKIVAINMLDLLGFVAKKMAKNNFCVLIKCTSSKVYVGQFSEKGEKVSQFVLLKDEISKLDEFEKFFFSDKDFFSYKSFKQLELSNEDYVSFLNEKILKNDFIQNEKLEPLYMALSQAEEELLKKEKKDE